MGLLRWWNIKCRSRSSADSAESDDKFDAVADGNGGPCAIDELA